MKFKLIVFIVFFFISNSLAMTIEEEKKLGRQFVGEVFRYYKVLDDYTIDKYINSLGNKLLTHSPNPKFNYNFYFILDDSYNAFAGPGAYIFVHTGLIEIIDNETELASIMSHEIAHVELRHISQIIDKSNKVSAGMIAGILLGVLAGGNSGELGSAAILGSFAAGQSLMLSYSREHEVEADQIGLKYLVLSGYDPKEFLKILRKIQNKNFYSSDAPVYMKTHPLSESRISYLQTGMGLIKDFKQEEIDSFFFLYIKTRLLSLSLEREIALKSFNPEKNPKDPLLNFAYSIALTRFGKINEAIQYIDLALSQKDYYYFKKTKIEILLEGMKFKEALNLSMELKKDNNDLELDFFIAKANLNLDNLDSAINDLKEISEKDAKFNQAIYLLANCYSIKKDMAKSHYYLGVFCQNTYSYQKAKGHFERALKYSKDPEEKALIQSKLSEII